VVKDLLNFNQGKRTKIIHFTAIDSSLRCHSDKAKEEAHNITHINHLQTNQLFFNAFALNFNNQKKIIFIFFPFFIGWYQRKF